MEFVVAICFLLVIVTIVATSLQMNLRKSSEQIHSSKYILNKFEPDNTAPKLTQMIDFHENNDIFKKYNAK